MADSGSPPCRLRATTPEAPRCRVRACFAGGECMSLLNVLQRSEKAEMGAEMFAAKPGLRSASIPWRLMPALVFLVLCAMPSRVLGQVARQDMGQDASHSVDPTLWGAARQGWRSVDLGPTRWAGVRPGLAGWHQGAARVDPHRRLQARRGAAGVDQLRRDRTRGGRAWQALRPHGLQ